MKKFTAMIVTVAFVAGCMVTGCSKKTETKGATDAGKAQNTAEQNMSGHNTHDGHDHGSHEGHDHSEHDGHNH